MVSSLKILYATSTGNARRIADSSRVKLEELGCEVEVGCLSKYSLEALRGSSHVVFVVSTWGDGDPPDAGKDFCAEIHGESGPHLDGLAYSVLALGDSCFENFCGCGVRLDESLFSLGARRLLPCEKLDVNYHVEMERWQEALVEVLKREAERAMGKEPAGVV